MNPVVFALFLAFLRVGSERIKLHTIGPEKGKDYNYFPLKSNHLEFNINAKRDVSILLSNQYDFAGPYYEIVLGAHGNTISVIKKNQSSHFAATHNGAAFPQASVYQRFWISLNDTEESVSVGKSPNRPFLYYQDPDYVRMSIFGITSGFGADAKWDFDHQMLNYNDCN